MLRHRSQVLVLGLAATFISCQPLPKGTSPATDTTPAEDVRRAPGEPSPALSFPPAATDRRARRPLATEYTGRKAGALAIVEPEVTGDKFEVYGQTVRFYFDRPVASREKNGPAKADTIAIAPAVAGKARWTTDHMLQFVADEPFDPDTEYSVTLAGLKAQDGTKLKAGWTAKFTAEPRVEVAGKILSYIPEPGKPRVVAVRPYSGERVGPNPRMWVLFDQPIGLKRARKLIELRREDKPASIKLSHPKSRAFEGVVVDPRNVVMVSSRKRLAPGDALELIARDLEQDEDRQPHAAELAVAKPTTFESVDCGYGYDSDRCEFADGTLRTSGRQVVLSFNNPIGTRGKALRRRVHVTPKPRNLSIYNDSYSSGRIVITGDLAPSGHYKVKVAGLRDEYGAKVRTPVDLEIVTDPRPASVSMADGVMVLDEHASKNFEVTSKNVEVAQLRVWPVEETPDAWRQARTRAQAGETPDGTAPIQIRVKPRARRNKNVHTKVNLLDRLEPGRSYLVSPVLDKTAFGAEPQTFPDWSDAGRPPVALVTAGNADALAVHAHASADSTLVHVARLATGKPVAGAGFRLNGETFASSVKTDKNGVALLPLSFTQSRGAVLRVESGKVQTQIQLGAGSLTETDLAPELAAGREPLRADVRALVMTDRGVYRPGARIFIKGSVRKPHGAKLTPAAWLPMQVRVIGPTGDDVFTASAFTNDAGAVMAQYQLAKNAKLGRHRIVVEPLLAPGNPWAETIIQVAEFEAPRFTVDVDAKRDDKRIVSTVKGRYLFGAPMDGAEVSWSLERQAASFPRGPLTDAGFAFRSERDEWWQEDDDDDDDGWLRTGTGTLGKDGTLALAQAIDMSGSTGPQRFMLEANVTDASYRAIAGRGTIVVHAAKRYAGLRVANPWSDVGRPIPVELGVIDQKGQPVVGARVKARLERIRWRYTRRRGPGGSVHYEWHKSRRKVDDCVASSALNAVKCELTPPGSGSYEISAQVDGHRDGRVSVWAWGNDGEQARLPDRGRRIQLVADKRAYKPGETAKVLIKSPFAEATAIVTVEQGGLRSHRTLRLTKPATTVDVPLTSGDAPHVHATVTLLPIRPHGDFAPDWKFGAIRLPVETSSARLEVAAKSDKSAYAPGDKASITIEVQSPTGPVANADVALAVVDEGVLRLTNFHAPDPVAALRPGQGLRVRLNDTRSGLAAMLERSHVAGDGAGPGTETVAHTRKNFVRTALWRPSIRTDENGHAKVDLTLPDNLTRFRIMAVAIDVDGNGGSNENGFRVRKPVMVIPAVPRFAAIGDRFEAAVMTHNNTDAAIEAVVSLGENNESVLLPANGRKRVAFAIEAARPGPMTLRFSVRDSEGKIRDRVEAVVPVQAPGVDERPRLAGAFTNQQDIFVEIPDGVQSDRNGDPFVSLSVGEHLWPELGSRLEYLIDYPHGCVEQTTSSTLPLLAAREILPRIGFTRMGREAIDDRIRAGLERLATMQTSAGGLGYWPGDHQPNIYGTAYAMRAVVRAKQAGVSAPAGLLEGMQGYLETHLLIPSVPVEVRAAIAQSLGELGALPASASDALYDTKDDQSTFGLASLAVALASLDGHDDRVASVLDELEAGFDEDGRLTRPASSKDFYYYGSNTRSSAQAAIALSRLRTSSRVLPLLVHELAQDPGSYTTQATAYSVLALAEHLRQSADDGAEFRVTLDGKELATTKDLGFGSRHYRIPIESVRGRKAVLRLQSSSERALAFMMSARWRRALTADGGPTETSSDTGPDVYRIITDAKGNAVDLEGLHPGQVLRVAMLVRMPTESLSRDRLGYLAVTDRIAAGFEPIQPDLWTVGSAPDLSERHPFYDLLRWGDGSASHVELRDDRVDLYFNRTWGRYVAATYLVRATTPGTFSQPPAIAELMYEGGSMAYGASQKVVIQ